MVDYPKFAALIRNGERSNVRVRSTVQKGAC
jgi:hypothetical protein